MTAGAITIHSPEHVAIALVPAGFGRRLGAFLLDLACIAVVSSLIASCCRFLPEALAALLGGAGAFLVMWGWHVWFEVRHAGRSPGKLACGLRVVDGRGLPLDLRQSVMRNVVRALDMMPLGGLGLLLCLIHPQRRRLGDLLADTLVVEERSGPAMALARLAGRRANSLDTPRIRQWVRHRLSLEEREFLLTLCLRADHLDDVARFALFERVGGHYRGHLAIDDPLLGGEAVVRGLVDLCFGGRN